MLITHDTRCALDCVVELLGTAPECNGDEGLPDLASLHQFVQNTQVSGVSQLAQEDLHAVRATRGRFAEVFRSTSDDAAAELLNSMIAAAGTTPRLSNHDDYDWHMHYFAPGATLAEHVAADGGMALAFLIVAGERERLRHCAAPDCRRPFVDLSRNRSRRYCDSRTCGNRLHVAAYRARQREAAVPLPAGPAD